MCSVERIAISHKTPTMRLPYIPDDPTFESSKDQEIVDRVKKRRGGKLIELDKALLHSPPVADGWNSFLGAIRTGTTLPDSLRETAICRVAVLNQAHYEWKQHMPILEKSGGVSAEGIQYLQSRPARGASREESEKVLDKKHTLVVEYTDAMTLGCIVPDPLFADMKQVFSDREIVEITGTIAAYNCVSRFLVALDVGEMAEKHGLNQSGRA